MGLLAKRIPTLIAILVLVLGVAGGIWMVKQQKPSINELEVQPKNVRITNLSDSKFTVSWVTNQPTKAKVVYGKVGEKLDKIATDDRDLGETEGEYFTHHITITKLQPNTQYAFKLVEGKTKFDNNGSPYTVKTAPVLSKTPAAETIYGVVKKDATSPAEGAIVYIDIPGATPLSTLVKASGNWTVPISVARTLDLSDYIDYDPDATIFSLLITDGKKQTRAKVALKFAKPVPDMNLGEKYEFLAKAEPSPEPNLNLSNGEEASQTAEIPKIFNIEPLDSSSDTNTNNATSSSATQVEIIYPEEGEVITSTTPEFRGTGPAGTTLNLSLESDLGQTISDTLAVNDDETWTWIPEEELENGDYNLTLSYLNSEDEEESVSRAFSVKASEVEPAFEASESGEATMATTRMTMPSTESGVPVSGSWQQTLLTLILGFGIMSLGGVLLTSGNDDDEI